MFVHQVIYLLFVKFSFDGSTIPTFFKSYEKRFGISESLVLGRISTGSLYIVNVRSGTPSFYTTLVF